MPLTEHGPEIATRELRRGQVALLCLLCALLLAYLSFIPFDYQPLPFDEALNRFLTLPYLAIGSQGRADWVANLLMYVPLGWLLARLLQPVPCGRIEFLALIGAILIGGAWAVAVEFAQLQFPNRTASLNDVLAEVLGTGVGAALWLSLGQRWTAWWKSVIRGGKQTARAALSAYVLVYFVLNVAPFDFVLNHSELMGRLRSPLVGAWMAQVSCGPASCAWRLLVEVALTAPLGLWWAHHRRGETALVEAVLLGIALGMLLEAVQLFLLSGVSQGASVLARSAGFALGTAAYARRDRLRRFDRQRYGRLLVLALFVPYLWVVIHLNGWWSGPWVDAAAAWERFGQIRWLPFQSQYSTSEPNAIRSALMHMVLYLPVGLAFLLWVRRVKDVSPIRAAQVAAVIAAVAEIGKLFFPPRQPDLTDVLLAAIAAGVTTALARSVFGGEGPHGASAQDCRAAKPTTTEAKRPALTPTATASEALRASAPAGDLNPSGGAPGSPLAARAMQALGAMAVLVAAATLIDFPAAGLLLAFGLIGYALLLVRVPHAYLWIVPAALPVLDLAPLTGRFFWDEFDLLLMVTLGVRLLVGLPPTNQSTKWPRYAIALLLVTTAASTLVALLPPPPLDANAFTSYLSPLNALRLSKGVLWGVLLGWLVARDGAAGAHVGRRLTEGFALALLALSIAVVWERTLFTGLLTLGGNYRAGGPISAMHAGGAYLDALLVGLLPFALLLALSRRHLLWRIMGLCGLIFGFYSLVVTFSRAPMVAWVIGACCFAALWARHVRYAKSQGARRGRVVGYALGGSILAIGVAAVAYLASPTLKARFADSVADIAVRDQHWRGVIGMMRFNAVHTLFGMGLGSFPRYSYLQQGADGRIGAYRFEQDATTGKSSLLLFGDSLFFQQRLAVDSGATLQVAVDARAVNRPARLSVYLCESAWVMNTARCDKGRVEVDHRSAEQRLTLRVPEAEHWRHESRPIALSLFTDDPGPVDIRRVSVTDETGLELLRNGDFAQGMDHWFFNSDDHLEWHPKNALVGVFFEQGVLGVLAWFGLALAVARRLTLADARLEQVPAVVASLASLLLIASLDTVIDAPRLITLVLLLAMFPLELDKPARSP